MNRMKRGVGYCQQTRKFRVWFTFSSNRSEQFVETAEAVTGRKIVDGIRKPGELMN